MSSLGMPNPVQQLGSLPYPPEGGLPADVAAALRLQQQQVQLHLGLPGGTLEEQLLAARGYAGDLGHTPMMPLAPLSAQQHAALSHILSPGSAATSLNSVGGAPHEAGGPDLRQLWQNVTRLEPGQGPSQLPLVRATPCPNRTSDIPAKDQCRSVYRRQKTSKGLLVGNCFVRGI